MRRIDQSIPRRLSNGSELVGDFWHDMSVLVVDSILRTRDIQQEPSRVLEVGEVQTPNVHLSCWKSEEQVLLF